MVSNTHCQPHIDCIIEYKKGVYVKGWILEGTYLAEDEFFADGSKKSVLRFRTVPSIKKEDLNTQMFEFTLKAGSTFADIAKEVNDRLTTYTRLKTLEPERIDGYKI